MKQLQRHLHPVASDTCMSCITSVQGEKRCIVQFEGGAVIVQYIHSLCLVLHLSKFYLQSHFHISG